MRFLKKFLKIFFVFSLVSTVILLVIGYIAFSYLPSRLFQQVENKKSFDVIIVPGVPYHGKKVSEIMKARILWANYLYSNGIAKNIIFSGSAVYTPYIESKVMALYAGELGIDRNNIFMETEAEHSTENLYYSYHLAKKKGFKTIALATDPFQNLMLWNFRKSVDEDIEMIPIKFDILKEMPQKDITIQAETAKVDDFVSIVERESWSERMKGTLGKKIRKVDDY